MLEFLPENVRSGLTHINQKMLYEIRLRVNAPVRINYGGIFRFLGPFGVTDCLDKALCCDYEDIKECVYRAGNCSVYSVEEQIKQGFITAKNGERLGLAGEYVFENGKPLAMRNFSSVCVRVPHEVIGCGHVIYNKCMPDINSGFLLLSSPGLGKTTILRDISRLLCEKTCKNVLICDERGEISSGNCGKTCDILKYSDKKTAFLSGIRALRPDVIITDELSESDCEVVKKAMVAGICVIASAHFSSMEAMKEPFFPLFEKYVLLKEGCLGEIKCIYDKNGMIFENGSFLQKKIAILCCFYYHKI